MKFMGDFYVFPGGAVDEDDGNHDWQHSHQQQHGQLQLLPPEEFSHRVAAIRELFEECGILCARPTSSQSSGKDRCVSVVPPDRCRNLERFRHEVHDDATRFRSVCRDHAITPDIAALRPWSRWVTPPGQSRRFDTFFYLTALSDGTMVPTPSVDAKETTHAVWMDPEEALSASRAGKIMLAPPTSYTLSELARCGNISKVLEHLSVRHFEPIHPKAGKTQESQMCALYPGDFAYDNPELSTEPRRGRPINRNIMQLTKDKHRYWTFEREGTKLDTSPISKL